MWSMKSRRSSRPTTPSCCGTPTTCSRSTSAGCSSTPPSSSGAGLKLPFETISREDRLNEDVVKTLAEMGCYRLWVGAESGSQRVLDAMQRRTDAVRMREMIKLLQHHGIEAGTFIMLGYDGEEPSDIAATVDHLTAALPDKLLTTVAYPIKGTPYYDQVADKVIPLKPWAEGSEPRHHRGWAAIIAFLPLRNALDGERGCMASPAHQHATKLPTPGQAVHQRQDRASWHAPDPARARAWPAAGRAGSALATMSATTPAFDAVAQRYDADFTERRLGRWLREAVHEQLAAAFCAWRACARAWLRHRR